MCAGLKRRYLLFGRISTFQVARLRSTFQGGFCLAIPKEEEEEGSTITRRRRRSREGGEEAAPLKGRRRDLRSIAVDPTDLNSFQMLRIFFKKKKSKFI